MTNPRTPEATFLALLDAVSQQAWADAAELYAADAVVEHPNAGPGSPVPRRLTGTAELREHFESVGALGFEVEPRNVRVHLTADPETVIGEFEYHGRSAASPEPFVMPNIFVMRVRGGLIVDSRDYQGAPRREGAEGL